MEKRDVYLLTQIIGYHSYSMITSKYNNAS